MKFLSAFVLLVGVFGTAVGFAVCPGACVNQGGQSMYDSLCKSAGEVNGRSGCEKYANFGCTYFQKQAVTYSGQCVNEGSNSMYDSLCATSGQVYGQSQCDKYSNLGCVWYPSRTVCK